MAPFLAFGANALAATIISLTIVCGINFSTTVHVDAKVGPDGRLRCLFLGDCEAVDVDHCFGSSQIMVIVLALGGILIADFALWAFSLHTACLEESALERPLVGTLARTLGSGRGQVVGEDENDRSGSGLYRRESSSALMTTALSALGCASALALFAPHKTALTVSQPLASYPPEDLAYIAVTFKKEAYVQALSGFMVESAAATRDAAKHSAMGSLNEPYVRESNLSAPPTHRIGDTTYQSLRTQGIGVNMASFNNYFLSSHDKRDSLKTSGLSLAEMYLTSNQSWMVAPDYQFQSLDARVWGSDIKIDCVDITPSFDVQWTWASVDPQLKVGNWKNPKRVIEIDVTHRLTKANMQILHSSQADVKITPWVKQEGDELVYIVTDTSTTIMRCDISGQEFLTDVTLHQDVLEIKDTRTDIQQIPRKRLIETRQAIVSVLEHSVASIVNALTAVRGTRHRVPRLDRELYSAVFGDIITDLAQAYWSLKRQQFETSTGIETKIAQLSYPSATNHGLLRGTFTRLGGSSWGLILPGLLLALPVVALVRLLLLGFHTLHLRRQRNAGRWQLLVQNEEEDIDYIDAPPPMPPPKDDDDEAPPPYCLDNLPPWEEPPTSATTQDT